MTDFLAEVAPLDAADRARRCVDLGVQARGDADAAAVVAALAHGQPYARALAVRTTYGSRDAALLGRLCADPHRDVRRMAQAAAVRLLAEDDLPPLAALPAAEDRAFVAARLAQTGRHAAVDTWLLAQPDRTEPEVLALAAFGSAAAFEALSDALVGAGPAAWARVAKRHPSLVRTLAEGLETGDTRGVWRLTPLLSPLAKWHPDHAVAALAAVLRSGVSLRTVRVALDRVIRRRPVAAFDLLRELHTSGPTLHRPGAFGGSRFGPVAHRLGAERLCWLVVNAPSALDDRGRKAVSWVLGLDAATRDAVLQTWLDRGYGSWGAFLLRFVKAEGPRAAQREAAFARWSTAARSKDGVIAVAVLDELPTDLRIREARRHLESVKWLKPRVEARIPYAGLLPVAECRDVLASHLGHHDPDRRRLAVTTLVGAARHHGADVDAVLAEVVRRRFEQDPIRGAMLAGLLALPVGHLTAAHLPTLSTVLTHARDAGDLSVATATSAYRLVARWFHLDPVWGGAELTALLGVRPQATFPVFSQNLTDDDVAGWSDALADLIGPWVVQERFHLVIALARSLGPRLRVAAPVCDALADIARVARDVWQTQSALALLRTHTAGRFVPLADALLDDRSAVLCQAVARHLGHHRQSRLSAWLDGGPVTGRFATTGKTTWVMQLGGERSWTPDDQGRLARLLDRVLDRDPLDTATASWAVDGLSRLRWLPGAELIARAGDPRAVVQERAVRALGRLDATVALSALVECLGDHRARWAIYAVRRALRSMAQADALALLGRAPLTRVTVAKEVVRLIGEVGGAAAHAILLAREGEDLHRDVRLALYRALWDHLHRPGTWAVYEAAVDDPDWVVAAKLTDLPLGLLDAEGEVRATALLARLLDRPEPEARLALLARAPSLPLTDRSRALIRILREHLGRGSVREGVMALQALLRRVRSSEVPLVVARIAGLSGDHRRLAALLEVLGGVSRLASAVERGIATGVRAALEGQRLLRPQELRLAGTCESADTLAARVAAIAEAGALHADAVRAGCEAAGRVPVPALVHTALHDHPDPGARRVALAALEAMTVGQDGWNARHRAALARFRADPDALVAGAAAFVFPPEEDGVRVDAAI